MNKKMFTFNYFITPLAPLILRGEFCHFFLVYSALESAVFVYGICKDFLLKTVCGNSLLPSYQNKVPTFREEDGHR